MEEVREALVAEGLAARTVTLYLSAIRRAEEWCEAHGSTLATAPPTMVAEYVASRPGSWATRNLLRTALGHYWRIVERPDPPLRAIRVPPKPVWPCQALEEDDARLLVKYARQLSEDGDRRGLAVLCGMFMALRRTEIAELRWEQVDGQQVRVVGKGAKTAWLPLHSSLAAALAAFPSDHEGPLFAGRLGGTVTPATIWQWTRHVAEEAGVGGQVRTHQLRHTALATANDNTGDLRSVQDFARHAKPETTAHYTRTTKRRLRQIVEAVEY